MDEILQKRLENATELIKRVYCASLEAQANERECFCAMSAGDYLIAIENLCKLFLRDMNGFDTVCDRDDRQKETVADVVRDIEECCDCFEEDANAFLGEIASRIRDARDARLFNLCREGGV